MVAKIFISYRREDSAHFAGRLHDRLEREFGRDSLFMDIDGIPFGADFVRAISEEVAKCDVLLAIIGPRWLDAEDENGRRRLDKESDFVRVEIASALKRDIPIVPILLEGTKVPNPDLLPDDLKPLALRNGLNVRQDSFQSDVGRLVRFLGERLKSRTKSSKDWIPPVLYPRLIVPLVAGMLILVWWLLRPAETNSIRADVIRGELPAGSECKGRDLYSAVSVSLPKESGPLPQVIFYAVSCAIPTASPRRKSLRYGRIPGDNEEPEGEYDYIYELYDMRDHNEIGLEPKVIWNTTVQNPFVFNNGKSDRHVVRSLSVPKNEKAKISVGDKTTSIDTIVPR
jgi:hypothetical protein